MNNNKVSMSRCNCDEEFQSEFALEKHQKTNCKNRYLSCVLCDERVTSCDMKNHLLLCGSKTNKCPKCSKYVQRSIYAYHLDRNCIDFDEDNISDQSYSISNRNDVQTDDEPFIPCEICDEQIKFSSYDYHLKNCFPNQTHYKQNFTPSPSIANYSTDEQKSRTSSNMNEIFNTNHFGNADTSSNEQSEMLNRSLEGINLDSDKELTNSSENDKKRGGRNAASQIQKKTIDVRASLSTDYYPPEIEHVTRELLFNILIMGSPRVGKSQLINALCNEENLAKTSSSLNSCTAQVQCYILEDDQERTPGIKPFRIYFYDTPGIESWTNQNGQETMLKFIEEKNPICLLYCASPGSFADLKQLQPILYLCKTKQIFCAFVCTNMWANVNRKIVIQEFEKELTFFGQKNEKLFDQGYNRQPHKVSLFGNGALCTMVNSKEYYDPELSDQRQPIQGIDELIHSIMEQLDNEKLVGWCNAVLYRRTYWEKVTQKVNGFCSTHLSNVSNISKEQILIHFAYRLYKMFKEQK